jgi:hypothetical protein
VSLRIDDDGLEIFAEYNGNELNNETFIDILTLAVENVNLECEDIIEEKISTAVGIIYMKIKNKELCHVNKEYSLIMYYLYITLCSYFIPYTRYPLFKYIK